MKYRKDTAGRILTTAVPSCLESDTASAVENLLRLKARSFDTINYIYVTDKVKRLVGVVSIKELLRLNPATTIGSAATRQLVVVRPNTDQERVAQLALKHSLKAIPVVTVKDHEFLGVVPSDRIQEVLNHEHTEDVMRFAGVSHRHGERNSADILLSAPATTHVRLRLPWLVLGLFGGLLAAVVVEQFEATLANYLVLAAFIPAIVYMADAVGSQTQMLFVRSLSMDHTLSVSNYLRRESKVNLFLGSLLSVLIFGVTLWWQKSFLISSILAVSIFLTVLFTVIVAIVLPWFFHRLGYDPAVASGPLATVVRDIASIFIYLGVATVLLSL